MARIRGGNQGRGHGRGRGRGRDRINLNQEQEAGPDPIQQLMGMMRGYQDTVNEIRTELREVQQLRNELREVQQKQNADTATHSNLGGSGEGHVPQARPEPVVPEVPVESIQTWVTRFNTHQPPIFKGRFDSQVAEDWLARLEKIFGILECPDDIKARLAIYKLEGDADKWWTSTAGILQAQDIHLTWEVFQEKFNEKYFPRSVRLAKEEEFLTIQQGEREGFDEYLARYSRLSRYSSYLQYRDDDEWRSDMMIRGLRPELKRELVARRFKQFTKAVEQCRITEHNLRELHTPKSTSSKNTAGGGSSSQKHQYPGGSSSGSNKKLYQPDSRGN